MTNEGTATLVGTIVAGNSGEQIEGNVTGSYNLIGTGGSGGLSASNHNLLNSADPLLAPLGDYGGPTQTMALLPGSPAIGAGTAVGGITTDQRGVARPASNPDIGAFQSQGFTLTLVGDLYAAESATISNAFANSLAVTVTANDTQEPVIAGGVVTFNAPASGASASLSGDTATIGVNDQASVTATANAIAGSYTVTASANGAGAAASFSLTNTAQPAFSHLAGPTIVYGTATTTLSGTILAGSTAPPGSVAVTLDGVTQSAAIGSDGSFSSVFDTTGLRVAKSPFTITYAYAANGGYAAVTDSSHMLTVTKATADGRRERCRRRSRYRQSLPRPRSA